MSMQANIKAIFSLLAVFAFLGMLTTPATATYAVSKTTMLMATNDEAPRVGEDVEPTAEESDAPYSEEERLQDDSSEPDENPNLENLTEEELKLYQELTGNSGR